MSGLRELERLFGAEHVRIDFRKPQSLGDEGKQPCYIVTVAADTPLMDAYPKSQFEMMSLFSKLDHFFERHLDLVNSMDNRVDDLAGHTQERFGFKPVDFIFRASEVEDPETVRRLKAITPQLIQHEMGVPKAEAVHEEHCRILRKATRGIRWEFKLDEDGAYYETARKIRRPADLQIRLLARLGLHEDYLIPSGDGTARMSFDAMDKGKVARLMESELSKEMCSLVPTGHGRGV